MTSGSRHVLGYAARTGLQGLGRHPRTTVLSIVTLGLGLAAVMTMLSLLAMLSADPLPGRSQQLFLAWADSRQAPTQAHPEPDNPQLQRTLWKLADVQAMFGLAAHTPQVALTESLLTVSDQDGRRKRSGQAVLTLGPMPSMFGMALRHGRFWTPQEERERATVAVIDTATSLALFGQGDGTGRTLRIGKGLFRVIGVSDRWRPRPAVHFLQNREPWQGGGTMAFVPALAALDAGVVPVGNRECDPVIPRRFTFDGLDTQACRWLALWAQLPTAEQRQAYAATLQRYAQDRHAQGTFQRPATSGLYDVPGWLRFNRVVPDSVRLNLWLGLGLLVLCLANVAGLQAARLLRRSGELGVRRVLGAPRRAVVVQCLVESGVTGLLGGLLAWPLTLGGLWVIRLQDRGYTDLAHFRPGLFVALLALAVCCGLLVGLVPAWRAARLAPALQVRSL